ncbi:MAG: hypothetical protein AB7F19_02990 [Candidatus Babeliales bacterium]
MKYTSLFLTLFISFSFFMESANAHPDDGQVFNAEQWNIEEQDPLTLFCSPVKFTRSGVRCFLKHVLNRAEYCQDFYPHSFSHVIEFLEYGNRTEQDLEYIISTLRLFNNKLKGSRFVTATAYSTFLEQLPATIATYAKPKEESVWENIQKSIKSILYNSFLTRFSFFKEEPDTFFNDITEQITQAVSQELIEDRISQEQFKQTLVRFLENGLNKVVWCPVAEEDVWKSVKQISTQLHNLYEQEIINEDELDDLYKSLLEQFCHFLDLCGSDLSIDIINQIKEDIEAGELNFLALDEQEEYIETKAERLTRAVLQTEAKAFARGYGIMTDVLPKRP